MLRIEINLWTLFLPLLLYRLSFFTHFDTWRVVLYFLSSHSIYIALPWFGFFDRSFFFFFLFFYFFYYRCCRRCCCVALLSCFFHFNHYMTQYFLSRASSFCLVSFSNQHAIYFGGMHTIWVTYMDEMCKNYIKDTDRTIHIHITSKYVYCSSLCTDSDHFSAVFFYCTCLYLFRMLFYFILFVLYFCSRSMFVEPGSRFSCIFDTLSEHKQDQKSNNLFLVFDSIATEIKCDNIIFWVCLWRPS